MSNRQITDAVGVVQEFLHSTKANTNTSFFLKLDLVKAYDRVDCSYLRLILIQIGLSPDLVDWIMSAVSSARFFSDYQWGSN